MTTLKKSPAGDIAAPEFAAAIKQQRERIGLTQVEAAELCKVSLRTWKGWELADGRDPLYPTKRGVLDILQTARRGK